MVETSLQWNICFLYVNITSFPHMKKLLFLIILLCASVVLAKTAIVITLEEMVDLGMADYTNRAIHQAKEKNPDFIIFEVNTFGGRLDAAFAISDTILAARGITTVALVNQKAISAGALISLSCRKLYMKPGTTIGDAAPVTQGQEGPVMLGEKIQSPLRAKFRSIAEINGYPQLLSMAMVSADLEVIQIQRGDSIRFLLAHEYEELSDAERKVWSSRRTVVREGELLTLTDSEALKFGFSSGTVESLDELTQKLGITEVIHIEISWSERLARFLGMISPVLMLIGFGALYMEFKTPGFGVFGFIGVAVLLVVFMSRYVSGLADHTATLLFALGAIAMLIEIFVFPGTLVSGMLAVGFFIAGLAFATQTGAPLPGSEELTRTIDWDQWMQNAVFTMVYALGGLIVPLIGARYLLPLVGTRSGLMVGETLADAVSFEKADSTLKVGDEGTTITVLRPGGKARFGSSTHEVISAGAWIDTGTPVRIARIDSFSVHVIAIAGEAQS
jgi:membrane-bound serine protease (ClpP class)